MEKELEAPLHQAISALEQHGYRYAIIGGVALVCFYQEQNTGD